MIFAAAIAFTVGVAALRALVFQLLWNMIVVDIFGCPITLGFWSSWGMLILGSLLFNTIPAVNFSKGSE